MKNIAHMIINSAKSYMESLNYQNRKPLFRVIICLCLLSGLIINPVLAQDDIKLPEGGVVISGSADISTSGSTMTITQNTDKMIANWESFDIGEDASVSFRQPGSLSVSLNRILDQNPSQILGSLNANGRVFLLNSSGIYFGQGASVDTGGLVASTLNISDLDFLDEHYIFETAGNRGTITNDGYISAPNGGYITLIAPQIINNGIISAPEGTVALASGEKVSLDFTGDRLINFVVDTGAVSSAIYNNGKVTSDGGTVILTSKASGELIDSVVNSSGIIEAKSIENQSGRIMLVSDMEHGRLDISGTLDVSGQVSGSVGGEIIATGKNITLGENTIINASGSAGGGNIFIGGGWQGKDTSIDNAETLTGNKQVSIFADAIDTGNGGTVALWSDESTSFSGKIFARGGASGGDGGNVEVSGKNSLFYSGITDARAPYGLTGNLLLDPVSIDIVDGGDGTGAITGATVYEQDLEAQLANITLLASGGSGYVRLNNLTTDGVLTLQDNINLTITAGDYFSHWYSYYYTTDVNDEIRASGTGTITIRAAMSLNSGKLTSNTGKITLWGDNGLTVGNTITTNGGAVELWADSDDLGGGQLVLNQAVTTNGGNVDLDAGTSGVIVNAPISTGTGRLYFDRLGTVRNATYRINSKISSTGDVNLNQTLQFGTGAEIETNGTLTVSSTSSMQNSSASLTLTANNFDLQQNITGNSATIRIKPYNSNTNVDMGAHDTGDMTITNTNLSKLVGFSNITVGRSDGTGVTKVVDTTSVNTPGYLELANGSIDVSGGTLSNTGGDIILTGNTFNVTKSITAESGTGKITMRQMTASNPISLGTDITNSQLDLLSAGTIELGRIDGGDITFDGNITTTTNALNILSGGDITIGEGVVLNVGTGTGTLAAVGNFINNSGSGAISTSGAGRWLIYSSGPVGDTFGGLSSNNSAIYNKTYVGYPPTSVTETGNRYLFSTQPHLTFTAINKEKTYGGIVSFSSPVIDTDYTMSGLINASSYGNVFTQDTYTGTPVMSSAGSSAGAAVSGSPYSISISAGTLTTPTGYAANVYTNGTLTINKAPLTVTAVNDSITYMGGAYTGGNGVSYNGLVNSETSSVLGGNLTYTGSSQGAINAGSYVLRPAGLTSANYNITFVDGELSITPAPLTITASNASKTYGQTYVFSGTEFTTSGLITDEYINSVTITSSGSAANAAVTSSPYAINISGATGGSYNQDTHTYVGGNFNPNNYSITYVNGSLEILPAPLTITAVDSFRVINSSSIFYGGSDVTYSGFVNDETVEVLSGELTYTGTSQGASAPGYYTIIPSGLESDNYDITFVGGILRLEKADAVNLISIQTSANSTLLSQRHDVGSPDLPSTGPGRGSVSIANYDGAGKVADDSLSGSVITSSSGFTSSVKFEKSGSTSTIITGEVSRSDTPVEVCTLQVFTDLNNDMVLKGSYMLKEGQNSLSLSETTYSGPDIGVGTVIGNAISFSISLPGGNVMDIKVAYTDNGFLKISIPELTEQMDVTDVILTGMMIIKNQGDMELKKFKGVILSR
jgi:filamentous hemagglutinin family protein